MNDSILIIGAGVAGINAALNAAGYGTKVYLADDTPSIGGMMARLDKTFPTNDCSICIEAPQMYEVDNHPNIEVLSNTEVRRVKKADGNFKVRLVQKARFIDEEKCTGCGACIEACPVSIQDEIDGRIFGNRRGRKFTSVSGIFKKFAYRLELCFGFCNNTVEIFTFSEFFEFRSVP